MTSKMEVNTKQSIWPMWGVYSSVFWNVESEFEVILELQGLLRSLRSPKGHSMKSNWRSLKNSHYHVGGVYSKVFGDIEFKFEVRLKERGVWRPLRSSIDLQNGGQYRMVNLTHVGCLFIGFWGCRVRIRGQIKVKRCLEAIEAIQWPPKWV